MRVYKCIQLDETLTTCIQYVESSSYSDFKLTNEQMITYVAGIAMLFTVVTVIKMIRRSYF